MNELGNNNGYAANLSGVASTHGMSCNKDKLVIGGKNTLKERSEESCLSATRQVVESLY